MRTPQEPSEPTSDQLAQYMHIKLTMHIHLYFYLYFILYCIYFCFLLSLIHI